MSIGGRGHGGGSNVHAASWLAQLTGRKRWGIRPPPSKGVPREDGWMVFGELLTGDNYDDSEDRVVGGRNGYGAKLANIFSTSFTVETADSSSGKR